MSAPTEDAVREALGRVIDPELRRSITDPGDWGTSLVLLAVMMNILLRPLMAWAARLQKREQKLAVDRKSVV